MATTDPTLAGLDLSGSFWGGFTVPNLAQAGHTVHVIPDSVLKLAYRDGIFTHPDDTHQFSIWPTYRSIDDGYILIVGTSDVITVPLADDTITELGFSVIARATSSLILYFRQGSVRIDRVNGGAPTASVVLDSYPEIDISSGEVSSDVVLSSNNAIIRHTLNQVANPAAIISSRVWVKETAI